MHTAMRTYARVVIKSTNGGLPKGQQDVIQGEGLPLKAERRNCVNGIPRFWNSCPLHSMLGACEVHLHLAPTRRFCKRIRNCDRRIHMSSLRVAHTHGVRAHRETALTWPSWLGALLAHAYTTMKLDYK